jgi:uncharacterized membrane protein YqaE (UPF0057 family)
MKKALLIILCFFLPFLAVLIHEGLTRSVLWAIVFQILGTSLASCTASTS